MCYWARITGACRQEKESDSSLLASLSDWSFGGADPYRKGSKQSTAAVERGHRRLRRHELNKRYSSRVLLVAQQAELGYLATERLEEHLHIISLNLLINVSNINCSAALLTLFFCTWKISDVYWHYGSLGWKYP